MLKIPQTFADWMDMMAKSVSRSRVISGVGVATIVAEENEKRICLIVGPASSGQTTIGIDGHSATGVGMGISGGPLILTLWEHGDIVRRRVYATNTVGGMDVGVIETFAT